MFNRLPVDQDFTEIEASAAEEYIHQLGSTGAGHAGDPEDLTPPERKRNISSAVAGYVSGFENDFADGHSFPLIKSGGIASDHVLDQRRFR